MVKIYISTYHNVQNFGAALQSYALQSFLGKLGYENELIKIKLSTKVVKKRFFDKERILRIINSVYNALHRKQILQGEQRFLQFFDNYHKTTAEYGNYEELLQNPPSDGIYLSGSDQVFNPVNIKPEFFLQFGDNNTRRISYAASVGVNSVPAQNKDTFKKYISAFDSISIRESYSRNLLKEYTKKNSDVNIDPSFLLTKEEWDSISSDSVSSAINEPYILVYAIYKPKWMNEVLKKLYRETKCKIVLVTYKNFRPIFCNKCIMNAGPREFLSLIKNAEMVISSSYHGNVFATVFEKPFYAIVNPDSPARIMSMLELFKLEKRVLTPETNIDFNVDYTDMKNILEKERIKSKEYLVSAIEGDSNDKHK